MPRHHVFFLLPEFCYSEDHTIFILGSQPDYATENLRTRDVDLTTREATRGDMGAEIVLSSASHLENHAHCWRLASQGPLVEKCQPGIYWRDCAIDERMWMNSDGTLGRVSGRSQDTRADLIS